MNWYGLIKILSINIRVIHYQFHRCLTEVIVWIQFWFWFACKYNFCMHLSDFGLFDSDFIDDKYIWCWMNMNCFGYCAMNFHIYMWIECFSVYVFDLLTGVTSLHHWQKWCKSALLNGRLRFIHVNQARKRNLHSIIALPFCMSILSISL